MQPTDFSYLFELENSFWWFAGMREITAALLDPFCPIETNRDVLDAGCGTGGMLSWLARRAGDGQVVGIDLSPAALGFCHKAGHPMVAQASVATLPFPDSKFDLVTSFDVLVQLPGADVADLALREMRRVLKPGGIAFVRVAAYEWMKSSHDTALATQHRYSLNELVGKVENAGFNLLRATYANSFLMPLAMFRRLVLKRIGLASGSDVKPPPALLRWINPLFTSVLRTEARWLNRNQARFGFGLSAICVAQKPADAHSLNSQIDRDTTTSSSTLS